MAGSSLGQAKFLAAYLNRQVLSMRWCLKEVYGPVLSEFERASGPKDGERINHEPFGPFRILAGILGTFCCYDEGCLFQVKYCM